MFKPYGTKRNSKDKLRSYYRRHVNNPGGTLATQGSRDSKQQLARKRTPLLFISLWYFLF
jgi:hypothetical protein